MGGLGNGRRGGRSPPLMIGALIACILVLGFNYWVSSSRNLELQTKLYELEGQVRQGTNERGVAELKKIEFQEQIQGQKEQIQRQKEQASSIEELYKRQLEEAQSTCGKDKGTMQLNISSSTKTIQQLKGKSQISQLNGDFGMLQKQLQGCQGSLDTLNKKFTYEMTQCSTQMLSQKEVCDERVAEAQKKLDKLKQAPAVSKADEGAAPTGEEEKARKQTEEGKLGLDDTKTLPVVNHSPAQANAKEASELLTNEIIVNKGLEAPAAETPDQGLPLPESESVVRVAAARLNTLPPLEGAATPQHEGPASLKPQRRNLTEGAAVEVMDIKDEEIEEADPGLDDMLIEQDKVEAAVGQKVTEPGDYDADEQMPGGVDLEKAQNQRMENTDKEMEEEVADYNGDEDNEGEFEADKQAELAQD
ncbi:Golgi membrane protein 1 isoform X2 [Gadus morhua]|uniref:Golgi membrane protein 1 isoform X2 n=1 Tax=Gadus morhua TaxID=8049 RepID=UPI0011B78BCF|nr:Golgi membrane protein 1 isoform X2 [Gadus morhua]